MAGRAAGRWSRATRCGTSCRRRAMPHRPSTRSGPDRPGSPATRMPGLERRRSSPRPGSCWTSSGSPCGTPAASEAGPGSPGLVALGARLVPRRRGRRDLHERAGPTWNEPRASGPGRQPPAGDDRAVTARRVPARTGASRSFPAFCGNPEAKAMRGRFVVWSAAVCAVALGCATAKSAERREPCPEVAHADERPGRLRPPILGPRHRGGGRQFGGASCQTARIVDSRPLARTTVLRPALLEVDRRRVVPRGIHAADVRGTARCFFVRTRLGGEPAYRPGSNANRTFFVQSADHRIQIVAGVVASPARRPARLAQVNRIPGLLDHVPARPLSAGLWSGTIAGRPETTVGACCGCLGEERAVGGEQLRPARPTHDVSHLVSLSYHLLAAAGARRPRRSWSTTRR